MSEDREFRNYFVAHWVGGGKEYREQITGSEESPQDVFEKVREFYGDKRFTVTIAVTVRGLNGEEEREVYDAAFTNAVHPLVTEYWDGNSADGIQIV